MQRALLAALAAGALTAAVIVGVADAKLSEPAAPAVMETGHVNDRLGELEQQVAKLKELLALPATVKELQGQVTALQSANTGLTSRVASVEQGNAALATRTHALEQANAALTLRVTSLEQAQTTLHSEIEGLAGSVGAIAALSNRVTQNEASFSALQALIGSVPAGATVQSQLDGLQGGLNAANTRIDALGAAVGPGPVGDLVAG